MLTKLFELVDELERLTLNDRLIKSLENGDLYILYEYLSCSGQEIRGVFLVKLSFSHNFNDDKIFCFFIFKTFENNNPKYYKNNSYVLNTSSPKRIFFTSSSYKKTWYLKKLPDD